MIHAVRLSWPIRVTPTVLNGISARMSSRLHRRLDTINHWLVYEVLAAVEGYTGHNKWKELLLKAKVCTRPFSNWHMLRSYHYEFNCYKRLFPAKCLYVTITLYLVTTIGLEVRTGSNVTWQNYLIVFSFNKTSECAIVSLEFLGHHFIVWFVSMPPSHWRSTDVWHRASFEHKTRQAF